MCVCCGEGERKKKKEDTYHSAQIRLCISLVCRSEVYDEWGKPKTEHSKPNIVCVPVLDDSSALSVIAVLCCSFCTRSIKGH